MCPCCISSPLRSNFVTNNRYEVIDSVFFLSTAKLKSVLSNKRYRKEITEKYDSYMAVLNNNDQPDLTLEVFHEFGIHTLKDLGRYLEKNGEYGGCVHVPWSKQLILIPFHHDFMNSWLRFDNPRVVDFYNKLYEFMEEKFDSRVHFDMKRFDVEEELQLNNWSMPPIDRRMLAAPISGCWDRPELIARFLELHGFKTKRLCCHDGHIMRGHCFTVYTDGNYWMTASSFPFNLKFRSYEKMCRYLYQGLKHVPIYSDNTRCELVEFKPPKPGIVTRNYLDNIKNGRVVVSNR